MRVATHSYAKKAEELRTTSLASAMETVEKLEVKLAAFAKTHKHAIQHDPVRGLLFSRCISLASQNSYHHLGVPCQIPRHVRAAWS